MMNDQTDKLPQVVRETGAQYVVDTKGQCVAVLLPIKEYEHYLEWRKSASGGPSAKAATLPAQDDSQPDDLVYPTDEAKEVTQILVAAGLMRAPVDRSSPPPDPVSAQERRELAEILGRAPGKPLSEIVIEERGEW